MKIFQVSEYISSAFDIILNNNQKKAIFNTLEKLYINNNINDEILLNLIKAFVIIFYNNPERSILYSNIFNNLTEEETTKIFNLLKKINFSYQMNMDELIINKIILTIDNYINNYINNIKNVNYYNILLNVFNIYDTIRLNKKITLQNKIKLFIISLKSNSNMIELRQIIALINKI
jgi:hypothetical protein